MNFAWLKTLSLTGLRVSLLLILFLVCCQSRLIYHPRRYDSAALANREVRELEYTTAQGVQRAWIHPAKATGSGVVWLIFGGNGTVALDWPGWLPERGERTFVLVDYPSYGASEGNPSPAHVRDSIVALFPALAKELNTTPEALRPRMRVFGHSLGCAAALMAMNELGIQRGLLLSPFSTMKEMAKRVVGWPLCETLYHRYDNITELQRLEKRGDCRLIIRHGTADEVIPVEQGRGLGRRFAAFVRYEDLPGARHNHVLDTHRAELHALMAQLE